MTEEEFTAAMSRSGLPLNPETLAEIGKACHIMEGMIARVTRDKPREAEAATVFYPEQRP
jgi:hypothetical protein